ncbi:hypothetical protein O6H91_Y254900 [Diphasiastrum complanatum]|nr:hypothetical protein O6H91_Y254900 [Diphasiastrum complanatum]
MGTSANLVVATAAGTCTALLTQPLDTASARMQTSAFGKSKGLWTTLAEGTWKEAFDGLGASLLLVSNPAIQYTVFEQLKRRLLERELKSKNAGGKDLAESKSRSSPVVLSAFTAFLVGAISKTAATVVTYPAIRCKVMIQAAEQESSKEPNNKQKDEQRPSKGLLQSFRIIWQREGAAGFYKGLQAQILKTVLGAALMLMIKEKVSQSTWLIMLALRRSLTGKPHLKVPIIQERKS